MNDATGMKCPITGCPVKHVLLATIVVFAVTFGFDFLFHGNFMKPHYEATASLWRPEADMQAMMKFCLIYHAVFAFGVAALYCWLGKASDCAGSKTATGIKFGLLLGLILGISEWSGYIWLPLPSLEIPNYWLVGKLLWGAVTGIALSFTCCWLNKSCKA